jgi:hypothetical protein
MQNYFGLTAFSSKIYECIKDFHCVLYMVFMETQTDAKK